MNRLHGLDEGLHIWINAHRHTPAHTHARLRTRMEGNKNKIK